MMGLYYYDPGIMIGLTVQIQQISKKKIYQANVSDQDSASRRDNKKILAIDQNDQNALLNR